MQMSGYWIAAVAAIALIAPITAQAGSCEDKAAWAAATKPDIDKTFALMKAQDKPGFTAMLPALQKRYAALPAAMPVAERCGGDVRVYDEHQFLAYDAAKKAGKPIDGFPASSNFVLTNLHYAELAYAVGWIQYEMEDFAGAKASYAKGLAIAPNQHDLTKEYVATLLSLSAYADMPPFIDRFLASDKDSAGAERANLIAAKGIGLAGLGDMPAATRAANEAKAIDPNNEYAQLVLNLVAQRSQAKPAQ
jgi:tetratricopeptide (TPR) repeat protein